ncbi:hypothetical protein [Larkinella rosea]|uniref:Secretion system C-terminal sorting domain-containing protein n=1 Tax=Larkinella rosea TaxID=2025312 RepID=A0A3P1BVQ1_9BACT|nr:hypothetical protein [Larkinella rosea]RRB04704.1 hypothetical protein EHT25_14635 [Larkinella rosea]
MKTLVKPLAVAFLLTFAGFAPSFAATRPTPVSKAAAYQTSLYTDAQGKLRVAVDKETGGTVEVRLVNTAGKEYFVQEIGKRQKAARLSLDISGLPDGAYQVVISNGVDAKVNHLTLATHKPEFTTRLIAVN